MRKLFNVRYLALTDDGVRLTKLGLLRHKIFALIISDQILYIDS